MLVPEIALTPAAASLFREAFGERVAIQHSGLSDGERHDQWQRIRRGDIDVVVGTRSAVFAPLEQVGLIVVDEEHDASYKQEESPRYNGRDVAIVRGQRAAALVVLGSATPSMESYHNAVAGKYERVVLERRVLDRPLASVTVVDMREEYAAEGPDVILSRALRDGIQTRLDRARAVAGPAEPPRLRDRGVLPPVRRHDRLPELQRLARRPRRGLGEAGALPLLQLHGARPVDLSAVRRAVSRAGRLRHRARRSRSAAPRVPAPASRGSIATRFGARARCRSLLARFRDGEIDVLVGTQMIAKGHDFPRVTLVGVVSADVGLGLADFRASERTFQLLTQVAGRAGRGEQPGEAIVQTLYPDHYSIQLACRQDYPAFYERELAFRTAMRYPPIVSLVNAVVRSRTFAGAMDDAADVVQKVRDGDGGALRILGPAPAPLGKLRGEYRAQLLIKGSNRRKMREALQAALASRPDLQRRIVVDVDPLSVLMTTVISLIGAGVKQSTNMTTANSASRSRVRSSGTCSSTTRGCIGPKTSSITTISPVQTIQLVAKKASTTAAPTVTKVTSVDQRDPSTA